jgi:tetratricopeptide (TPR) repeat protein
MYHPRLSATPTGVRSRLAAIFIAAALLGGCATPPAESPRAAASLDTVTREADAELAKGNKEQAVAMLTQGARSYPTSPAPWLRIANIWFDAGNYPSAILAANEALQRDASSQEAKSLLVVGGLRVAAGAVAGLRPTGGVGANARTEAENLTNSLRTVIGEKALVPATPNEARTSSPVARPKTRPARTAALPKEQAVGGSASKGRSTDSASNDPFKSLK